LVQTRTERYLHIQYFSLSILSYLFYFFYFYENDNIQ